MSAQRPALPAIPPTDAADHRLMSAIKERLELVAGERGTKLPTLPSTATLPQVITAYNNLVALLQG